MATVAEILVQTWIGNISDVDRERLDAAANRIGARLVHFATEVGRAVDTIGRSLAKSIEQTEIDDRRRSLLLLYRQRHSWKTADLARLQTYSLNKAARNRAAKIKALKLVGR